MVSGVVAAQHLPIQNLHGLPRVTVDIVMRIKRDSHGFLWFCTRDGLSKIRWLPVTNYGREQGLPYPCVNNLIESRDGTYW